VCCLCILSNIECPVSALRIIRSAVTVNNDRVVTVSKDRIVTISKNRVVTISNDRVVTVSTDRVVSVSKRSKDIVVTVIIIE